jgi:hypothetical protein
VTRRTVLAAAIVAAWLGGVAALARRELFRGEAERMVQAGLLIAPGAQYFTVTRDSDRVGYASSTIDTSATRIHVSEFLLTEDPEGSAVRRMAVRGIVNLTRGMHLTDFRFDLGESYGPWSSVGTVSADSMLTVVTTSGHAKPDTTRRQLRGQLMLPTTVPLAMVLERRPVVGRHQTFTLYDPLRDTVYDISVHIRAESLFVITDSATLDPSTARWTAANQDTVRAWRLETVGGGIVSGWVDEKGRIVRAVPLGEFTVHRTAYEIAFQNWTLDNREHPRAAVPSPLAADSVAANAAHD